MGRTKDFLGIVAEATREALPGVSERYNARILTSEAEVYMARRLAAATFVRLGALDVDEVDACGVPHHDPWLGRSVYFGTFDRQHDNELAVTGRLIWSPEAGVVATRLPVEQIDAAHAQRLLQLQPGKTAEIGSLVKRSSIATEQVAVLKLIRRMWQFAADKRIEELTCGLKPSLLPRYKALFGAALTNLASQDEPYVQYPGVLGPQVPLSINVTESFRRQRDIGRAEHFGQRLERFTVRHYITAGNDMIQRASLPRRDDALLHEGHEVR